VVVECFRITYAGGQNVRGGTPQRFTEIIIFQSSRRIWARARKHRIRMADFIAPI
jgi:hypothetical protein